jgi:hypothetical protein
VRKVASDFGWDWGPAFLPIGIWQNIRCVLEIKSKFLSIATRLYIVLHQSGIISQ